MSHYGCHNKPQPVANSPITVQDGWDTVMEGQSRIPRMVTIPFVMSTTCHYDATATDPNCAGCYQAKGAV